MKEVVTDASTLLRIFGTYTVENADDAHDHDHKSNNIHNEPRFSTKSVQCVSGSSEKYSTIRLFIGSSLVTYQSGLAHGRALQGVNGNALEPYQIHNVPARLQAFLRN